MLSHPTRVRGLKQISHRRAAMGGGVAPHAGAWIETLLPSARKRPWCTSHPTRVRGLKLDAAAIHVIKRAGRTPRGCVD